MRQCSNAYGGAWLPFLTRRLIRAIRRNPFAALLVEGFLLFAMVSLLSTPMAWATDGIEEWNDTSLDSGEQESGGVRVETGEPVATTPAQQETMEKMKQEQPKSFEEEYARQEATQQQQQTNTQQNSQDTKSDTTDSGTTASTQTNNGMGSGLTSTGGAALDPSMLNARTAISRVNLVVTGLLLPVGIVWASWQIVYIALVCGLLGIDPLDLISAEDEKTPWVAIKRRLVNFATGLALVGGIWLIFELVLFLVANFVGALETNL